MSDATNKGPFAQAVGALQRFAPPIIGPATVAIGALQDNCVNIGVGVLLTVVAGINILLRREQKKMAREMARLSTSQGNSGDSEGPVASAEQ